MNIRPLADRVLIKPAAAEEKTLGGIIIPDSAKEKPLKGEVVAVGNGTKDEEMVVKNAILYCTASMQVRKSNWTVKNILSCVSLIFWLLSKQLTIDSG